MGGPLVGPLFGGGSGSLARVTPSFLCGVKAFGGAFFCLFAVGNRHGYGYKPRCAFTNRLERSHFRP